MENLESEYLSKADPFFARSRPQHERLQNAMTDFISAQEQYEEDAEEFFERGQRRRRLVESRKGVREKRGRD